LLKYRLKKYAGSLIKATRAAALLIALILFMAACSPAIAQPTLDIQATLAHNVSGTLTAAAPSSTSPLPTLAPFPTFTQSLTPTVSYSGLPASVNVTSIILRSGPSTLFERISTFPEATQVTIMGRIPNSEWVWVITPKASSGWMAAQFLNSEDLTGVPIIDVPSSITITGNAMDTSNLGVDGIDVAVFQGNGAERRRTDTYTSSDGSFTVYLPDSSQGVWNVEAVGIKCTSRVMDASCKSTGSITNSGFTVSLPQTITISFIYDPN
jgi:hypothetical protein